MLELLISAAAESGFCSFALDLYESEGLIAIADCDGELTFYDSLEEAYEGFSEEL